MDSKTAIILKLGKNLAASTTYWYFKDFNCVKNTKTGDLCTELTAWLVTSAVVIYLSLHELIPQALSQCVKIRTLYNVVAAVIYSHITLCYIWMELVAYSLTMFGFLDDKARKVGLGMLTDNALYTLRRHDGYVNVFTFMAWILFMASLRSWLKFFIKRRPSTSQGDQESVGSGESSDSDEFLPHCPPLPKSK